MHALLQLAFIGVAKHSRKGAIMKGRKLSAVALFLMLALAAAFAAATGSARVTLNNAAQLNGTKLAAGTYKVTWTAEGEKAQVVFKNGNTEVKANAKIVELKVAPANGAVVKNTAGELKEVWFGGKTTTLVFTE